MREEKEKNGIEAERITAEYSSLQEKQNRYAHFDVLSIAHLFQSTNFKVNKGKSSYI